MPRKRDRLIQCFLVVLATSLANHAVAAQTRAMNRNDPESIARTEKVIIDRAMKNIVLEPEQERGARKIVHTTMLEELAMDWKKPGMYETLLEMNRKRDSALKALLVKPEDKAKFDQNVSRPSAPRPPAQ